MCSDGRHAFLGLPELHQWRYGRVWWYWERGGLWERVGSWSDWCIGALCYRVWRAEGLERNLRCSPRCKQLHVEASQTGRAWSANKAADGSDTARSVPFRQTCLFVSNAPDVTFSEMAPFVCVGPPVCVLVFCSLVLWNLKCAVRMD